MLPHPIPDLHHEYLSGLGVPLTEETNGDGDPVISHALGKDIAVEAEYEVPVSSLSNRYEE